MTKADVDKLLELPANERAALASRLWQSLEHDPTLLVTDDEKRLIDERLAEAKANPDAGIPWEKVEAELWPDG